MHEQSQDTRSKVAIEGKGEVMRVSIPKSAAATFATVAGITGVQVEELYTAMITSSADAFFSAQATQVKLEQTALYRKCRGLPAKAVPELRPSYYPGRPVEPRATP